MARRKKIKQSAVIFKKRIYGKNTFDKKPYNGAYAAPHEKTILFLSDFIKI